MKICGIYQITSPSKRIYIGQSIDIIHRFIDYKHLNANCKSQTLLYRSLKKYGTGKHKFEILCLCDKTELNNLEKYYIELFNTFNSVYGLNLKAGGSHGGLSDITKKKMSDKKKGKNHPLFGKFRTDEWKNKVRGRKRTEETKQKMRRPHSEKTKINMRNAIRTGKGKNHLQYIKNNIGIKTQTQIAKELNIHQSTISKLLKKCT